MYKNRKKIYFLCLLLLIFLVSSSCSFIDAAESKADEKEKINEKTDYLDFNLFSEAKKKEEKIYEIQYGIFEGTVPRSNAIANSQMYFQQSVKVTAEGEHMVLQPTEKLENHMYVEKGDVLATIEQQDNSTDILEIELKLQRLQNNLNRESKYYQEEHEKKVKEYEEKKEEPIAKTIEKTGIDVSTEAKRRIFYIEREKEINIERISLEREALEWENKKRNYERDIQKTQIELEKLRKKAEAATIVAPKSGYVVKDRFEIQTDEHVKSGDTICNIVDFDHNLLCLDNSEGIYNYGMQFNWLVNTDKGKIELLVKMINGGSNILFGNLASSPAFFCLSKEEKNDENIYMNKGKIAGGFNTIENVLLVPVNAVTLGEEGDFPNVTVVNEDGSYLKTEFIPGDSNADYYWVLSGLEEGMQILLKE